MFDIENDANKNDFYGLLLPMRSFKQMQFICFSHAYIYCCLLLTSKNKLQLDVVLKLQDKFVN